MSTFLHESRLSRALPPITHTKTSQTPKWEINCAGLIVFVFSSSLILSSVFFLFWLFHTQIFLSMLHAIDWCCLSFFYQGNKVKLFVDHCWVKRWPFFRVCWRDEYTKCVFFFPLNVYFAQKTPVCSGVFNIDVGIGSRLSEITYMDMWQVNYSDIFHGFSCKCTVNYDRWSLKSKEKMATKNLYKSRPYVFCF